MSDACLRAIDYYMNGQGISPFLQWFDELSVGAQARVRSRLNRVAFGNLGKINSVGEGVHELKFKDRGYPTYRIYFGNDGDVLIIIPLGGDKSSQPNDIKKAKEYWHDYKKNK